MADVEAAEEEEDMVVAVTGMIMAAILTLATITIQGTSNTPLSSFLFGSLLPVFLYFVFASL